MKAVPSFSSSNKCSKRSTSSDNRENNKVSGNQGDVNNTKKFKKQKKKKRRRENDRRLIFQSSSHSSEEDNVLEPQPKKRPMPTKPSPKKEKAHLEEPLIHAKPPMNGTIAKYNGSLYDPISSEEDLVKDNGGIYEFISSQEDEIIEIPRPTLKEPDQQKNKNNNAVHSSFIENLPDIGMPFDKIIINTSLANLVTFPGPCSVLALYGLTYGHHAGK